MDGSPERRTLAVSRTASFHVLGEPGRARSLWFVLHGYGQLARDFLESFRGLAGPDRAFVAPEGLSRFYLGRRSGAIGASWMTRENRGEEIEDYVRFLDAVLERVPGTPEVPPVGGRPRPREIGVLGFSQGAATAARWTALGSVRPQALVLWGARLPDDLDVERLREHLGGGRLTSVAGERDRDFDAAAAEADLERALRGRIPARVMRFPGGHELDPDVLREIVGGPAVEPRAPE